MHTHIPGPGPCVSVGRCEVLVLVRIADGTYAMCMCMFLCLKKTSTGTIHHQTKNHTTGTCRSILWLVAAYGYCGNLPCARAGSACGLTLPLQWLPNHEPPSTSNANTGNIIIMGSLFILNKGTHVPAVGVLALCGWVLKSAFPLTNSTLGGERKQAHGTCKSGLLQ
jgi:hypothetical protein